MSFINLKDKVVQVKIVYYGPGRCGKTTNLEYINRKFREQIQSEMVSLKTHGDRTLFFDFLPFHMGQIKGYDIKIQLYTVPGQVKYNATRKLVLKGVDGIVFVADAMEKQREKNIRSLNQLHENLQAYKESIFKIPLVMQYNKVDLKDHGIPVLPISVLQQDLNSRLQVPYFEASAITGYNVAATLKKIISSTVVSIQKKLL
ncbi:MAG: GTPase domain-containing protein [Proteobacteria bacterium]|nr:GTPase domain-containing protein [Desulfocapsa sp.]MBU3945692.1 GTPase domain-containing protein [Pseudomonadota bacterium]MCG2745015.1 GTPase domain-containing protein [Desulfobacteraceae bacterium]MDD3816101.1 GTPase domain-containing protein [Desulfocapsaceae bacterium]MBU4027410.1 GTPase domain-containing protein [Pseudomonadota bacterium]